MCRDKVEISVGHGLPLIPAAVAAVGVVVGLPSKGSCEMDRCGGGGTTTVSRPTRGGRLEQHHPLKITSLSAPSLGAFIWPSFSPSSATLVGGHLGQDTVYSGSVSQRNARRNECLCIGRSGFFF